MSKKRTLFALVIVILAITIYAVNFQPQLLSWLNNNIAKITGLYSKYQTSTQSSRESNVVQKVVDEESAVIKAVEEVSPAVVSIIADQVVWDPFSGPIREQGGIGTGFIVDKNGLIVTNKHVVANTNVKYFVVLKDKTKYEVDKIFRDPLNDVAIIKINEVKFKNVVQWGDSSKLKVGQTVIAIGNALGRLDNTVTKGVVSAIGRGVTASSPLGQSEVLENAIQTDAALNPGNSGGPLLNLSGQVIGINVAISQDAQNIGFAIPVNIVKPVVDDFKAKGKITMPFLGIEYFMITKEIAELRNLTQGAFVKSVVEGSEAEKAGIKAGDIITKVDSEVIGEERSLGKVILSHKVGEKLRLTIIRDDKEIALTAVLGEAPIE